MKIVNAICCILFLLFAWFQRNDIDPEIYYKPSGLDSTLWLLFYLLIAGMFGLAFFGRKIPTWVIVIGVLASLVEMGRSGPGLWQNLFGEEDFSMTQASMSAEDPRVELSREFFGALIALAAVVFLWCQQCGCCRKKSSPEE